MKIVNFVKVLLFTCSILGFIIFLMYRPIHWPLALESGLCFIVSVLFLAILIAFSRFQNKWIDKVQHANILFGLLIGLLWSVEISINNFIQPGLPDRDIIDNVFWIIITILLLIKISIDSYKSKSLISGLKAGLWTGFASGLVACTTAMLVIVFFDDSIIKDPLNIKEWNDLNATTFTKDISVYFAFQTYAGALLHFYILGMIFGLFFGIIGGIIGIGLNFIFSKKLK
ncbi:MAG: hypothetical protein NTW10_02470 [Bacteroidetes bacterium]|nr:hypothetical protein [Bacteroidota bacterium]